MRHSKVLAIWIVAILVVLSLPIVLTAVFRWSSTPVVVGDCQVLDRGLWSYPRYSLVFDSISLGETETRRWSFRGAPATTMTLELRASDPVVPAWHSSEAVSLKAKLTQPDGSAVVSVDAPLSEWILSRGGSEFNLWHPKLRDIPMATDGTYELEFEVNYAGNQKGAPIVTPQLEGGGNELP